MISRKIKVAVIAALILFAVYLSLLGTNDPFVGTYNANNNYLMLSARNFHRFGFFRLSMLPTYFAGDKLPEPVPFYLHHPPLLYWLVTLAHGLFGYANWVTHLVSYLFFWATAGVIYFFVRLVWSRDAAVWSALSYLLFPLSAVLWKVQFFEQMTLFLTLFSLLMLFLHRKQPKKRYLFAIGLATAVNALTDWYAGYLAFVFLYLTIFKNDRQTKTVFAVYAGSLAVGLVIFLTAVLRAPGGLAELTAAISARAFAGELTAQSYWPVRLFVLTLIRLVIYLTPLFLVAAFYFVRNSLNSLLERQAAASLFILGAVNILFLPTATWGHTYFLYYFLPLAAVIFGVTLTSFLKRRLSVFGGFLLLFLLFSYLTADLKDYQQKKQLWKYRFAADIISYLVPYEPVAVINFPGDILENYFFHPTKPLSLAQINTESEKALPPVVVIACMPGECPEEGLPLAVSGSGKYDIYPFSYGNNRGFLYRQNPSGRGRVAPEISAGDGVGSGQPCILNVYRLIRDRIGGIQI